MAGSSLTDQSRVVTPPYRNKPVEVVWASNKDASWVNIQACPTERKPEAGLGTLWCPPGETGGGPSLSILLSDVKPSHATGQTTGTTNWQKKSSCWNGSVKVHMSTRLN